MNKNLFVLQLFILFCFNQAFSQVDTTKKIQISPYLGISQPLGDFKDFAKSGTAFGISADKYLSKKFALGVDFNYQSNSFQTSYDFSGITNPFSIVESQNGNWSTSTLTFGPTYRIGIKKFNAEIYSKAGISYTQSPSYEAILSNSSFSKSILTLPEQERTSFGLTSGIRFNYQVTDKLNLFLNPQFVFSSSEVQYCNCGLDNLDNPELIIDQDPIKKIFSPSYFNVNAGLSFSFGGTQSTNRNLPICDISLVELECTDTSTTLQLSLFWNNFSPNFTRTVEVFDGNTLINPTSSTPNALSQSYGNIPFYTSIPSNLIGSNLSADIKIFDTNGNVVCSKSINFTVPQCSPQPPSCDFNLDIENVSCDANLINYNAIGNWANLNSGSIIDIVAADQSGNVINLGVTPNPFPITITATNTSGSLNNTVVSIPSSYNGTPISIMLKITQPTTGYEKLCGFADLFTPLCVPTSTICDWEYEATCDSVNNGIKIDVTSSWSSAPVGSTLRYKLINLNGGANIPFTFSPNNLPQNIAASGSSSHTLYINSSFSGAQAVFKMEIIDGNGNVLCNEGMDIKLPSCVFKTCEPKEISTKCENGNVIIDFEVPWTNFNQFANLYVFADIYDSNNPANIIQSLSRPLTGVNGTAQFYNISLPQQYSGTTIYIQTRICKMGEPAQKCDCLKKLIIDIPNCCEICSDLDIEDTTSINQTFFQDFTIRGFINSTEPIIKVVAQLESIGFDNRVGIVSPTNFEFRLGSYMDNGIASNGTQSNIMGSTSGGRSNLLVHDFIAPTLAVNFNLLVDNYNKKKIMYYKVKLTIFKQDGTYCERFLTYTR